MAKYTITMKCEHEQRMITRDELLKKIEQGELLRQDGKLLLLGDPSPDVPANLVKKLVNEGILEPVYRDKDYIEFRLKPKQMTDSELIQKLLDGEHFKNMSAIARYVGVSPVQISRVRTGRQHLRARIRDWLVQKLQSTPKSTKPILCLDFDGVIHSYFSGWKGASIIPDPPVQGAFAFIQEALQYFEVAVFSSRSTQPGGIVAMKEWFLLYKWPKDVEGNPEGIYFPTEKPPVFLTIDDRVMLFAGIWPDAKELLKFRPWHHMKKRIVEQHVDDVPFGIRY
jgi:hypothetical protein